MSKKNSSVNLKNGFKNYKDLSNIFQNFKNKLDSLNKNSYTVGVSGGPDSLALVALTSAYLYTKKIKFYYVLVDHNIRKNSANEAKQVKNLLKKNNMKQLIIISMLSIFATIGCSQKNGGTSKTDNTKNLKIENYIQGKDYEKYSRSSQKYKV